MPPKKLSHLAGQLQRANGADWFATPSLAQAIPDLLELRQLRAYVAPDNEIPIGLVLAALRTRVEEIVNTLVAEDQTSDPSRANQTKVLADGLFGLTPEWSGISIGDRRHRLRMKLYPKARSDAPIRHTDEPILLNRIAAALEAGELEFSVNSKDSDPVIQALTHALLFNMAIRTQHNRVKYTGKLATDAEAHCVFILSKAADYRRKFREVYLAAFTEPSEGRARGWKLGLVLARGMPGPEMTSREAGLLEWAADEHAANVHRFLSTLEDSPVGRSLLEKWKPWTDLCSCEPFEHEPSCIWHWFVMCGNKYTEYWDLPAGEEPPAEFRDWLKQAPLERRKFLASHGQTGDIVIDWLWTN